VDVDMDGDVDVEMDGDMAGTTGCECAHAVSTGFSEFRRGVSCDLTFEKISCLRRVGSTRGGITHSQLHYSAWRQTSGGLVRERHFGQYVRGE